MTERIALGDKTLASERETAECEGPFAALVERQARFVFRVAYTALRNSQDAEDVAQRRVSEALSDWRVAADERRMRVSIAACLASGSGQDR